MKRFIVALLIILPLCSYVDSNADAIKNVKLAIFDNPAIDATNPALSQDLQEAYMQGVKTAMYMAKKKGIKIDAKTFFYGNSLLNVIQQVPNIKTWNPDVIMGLNSSNSALMSRSYFTDQLVLSISATDIELSKLPPNFYSLGTPDLYTTNQIIKFISQRYPNRGLFLIVGAESKESVDFASLIASYYKKANPKQSVRQSRFLSDDVNTMNISALVKDYKPGDVIFLFSISGTYNTQINLMNKIADYLAPNKMIFITPADNWKGRELLANVGDTSNPYTAYRLDTLYVDTDSEDYLDFSSNFEKIYHTKPSASISYITYRTVMSVLAAIEKYPAPKTLSTQEAVLWSYHQALKNNPNWFRYMPIVIFKIEPHKEVYFTSLQ